ncbi:MAG: four-carbon acid sugar kinase family protein [Youngiibacter sp.]|nr:four-carbon acid sugar kinase family protein [Youngiibacter sp.]
MQNVVVIADDLTGACDSGVKLLKQGYRAEVIIDPVSFNGFGETGNAILSVNTESRSMEAKDAYESVFGTAMRMKGLGYSKFYKKIDSVLRGNIGTEIDAMLDAVGVDLAIVASALPANGRIVIEGKLNVLAGGEPVSVYPALEGVSRGSRRKAGSIYIDTVRKGPEAIFSEIVKLKSEGCGIIVLDSATNDDLELVARALDMVTDEFIPVGTGGLINHLDKFWLKDGDGKGEVNSASNLDVLIVVGSKHPTTSAQVKELLVRGDVYVSAMDVDGFDECKAEEQLNAVISDAIGNRKEIRGKKALLLTTYTMLKDEERDVVYTSNVSNNLITETITKAAEDLMHRFELKKVVVTGGDTASSLFTNIGAMKIDLLDEPMPGIVTGCIKDNGLNLLVSTKSGGFGAANTLTDLLDYMADIKEWGTK